MSLNYDICVIEVPAVAETTCFVQSHSTTFPLQKKNHYCKILYRCANCAFRTTNDLPNFRYKPHASHQFRTLK